MLKKCLNVRLSQKLMKINKEIIKLQKIKRIGKMRMFKIIHSKNYHIVKKLVKQLIHQYREAKNFMRFLSDFSKGLIEQQKKLNMKNSKMNVHLIQT